MENNKLLELKIQLLELKIQLLEGGNVKDNKIYTVGETAIKLGISKRAVQTRCKHNGLYKIGKSINPKVRERTLQSEKPSIEMVRVWNYDIEKKLHSLYNEFRVRGEYFNLTPIQVKYICTHF